MKAALFQCPTGISGNMLLGTLADAGLDWEHFRAALKAGLPIGPFDLTKQHVQKKGLTATLVTVGFPHQHSHRHLKDIESLLAGSSLPEKVLLDSKRVFQRLATAEAAVHNRSVEQVHFHEVGAVDAIVDIVGTVYALHLLKVEAVYSSPLPLGTGFVTCEHGTIPVPAPATLKLLEGFPTAAHPPLCSGELTTPTGAALLTTLAKFTSEGVALNNIQVGFGAGSRDLPVPNAARVILGTREESSSSLEKVTVIETTIDDMNPEFYGYLLNRLLESGALDVFITPVYMKGNRPGTLLSVLSPPGLTMDLVGILQAETTSLGFRIHEESRIVSPRHFITVTTSFGKIAVKVATYGDHFNIAPEYRDCAAAAKKTGIPVKTIYDEAKALALKSIHTGDG